MNDFSDKTTREIREYLHLDEIAQALEEGKKDSEETGRLLLAETEADVFVGAYPDELDWSN